MKMNCICCKTIVAMRSLTHPNIRPGKTGADTNSAKLIIGEKKRSTLQEVFIKFMYRCPACGCVPPFFEVLCYH